MTPIRVTNTPTVNEAYPTWSPEDAEIAFRGGERNHTGIMAIRPDGTDLRSIIKCGTEPHWRRAR